MARGSSPEKDLPSGPPYNPPIESFGWLAPNPHMFTPPWYQPLVVQLVLEPTTKLPYRKLQYQLMLKTLIMMLTSEYSRRPLKLMVK